jgi:hypothetical protein
MRTTNWLHALGTTSRCPPMNLSVVRVVSGVLTLTAVGIGAVGLAQAVQTTRALLTWPRRLAFVKSLSVEDSPRTSMYTLRLCYAGALSERCVYAWQFRAFGRDRFERDYAVGSRHTIWLDPSRSAAAEVDLGWNFSTLFVPSLCVSLAVGLLFTARHYWRRDVSLSRERCI